jgi:hypothetical protein
VTVLHARAHERRGTPAAKSTVRGYLMVIRSFCSFLCEPRYGWAELCHKLFGEYPAQVLGWCDPARCRSRNHL